MDEDKKSIKVLKLILAFILAIIFMIVCVFMPFYLILQL